MEYRMTKYHIYREWRYEGGTSEYITTLTTLEATEAFCDESERIDIDFVYFWDEEESTDEQ